MSITTENRIKEVADRIVEELRAKGGTVTTNDRPRGGISGIILNGVSLDLIISDEFSWSRRPTGKLEISVGYKIGHGFDRTRTFKEGNKGFNYDKIVEASYAFMEATKRLQELRNEKRAELAQGEHIVKVLLELHPWAERYVSSDDAEIRFTFKTKDETEMLALLDAVKEAGLK